MKKILVPVSADPTISFNFAFTVGSQDDPVGKEGLAALTAELLTRGATQRNSYEAILERLYPLATNYYASIDREMTSISGRVHGDKLTEFVELLTDALLHPAFTAADFERLRNDAINAVANTLRYSSDEDLGKAALTAAVFRGTRYAHPIEGTVRGLEAITLADVRSFYESHFVQSRLTLGLAGGYGDALVTDLERVCSQLPPGTADEPPPIEAHAIEGRRVILVDKPGADASISFGYPVGVARGETEFYALWLANSWLGEHRHGASHLYQVIREARGLNYGNYSYIEAFPHGGLLQMPPVNVPRRHQLFEVWLRTLPNAQAPFALRAALREIDHLVEHGLTAEQFELTRRFLTKYSTHYAPTTAARLGYAIDDAFYGLDGEGHLDRFSRIMGSLTLNDVNAAIRQHWQTDDLVIAIVTGDAGTLAATLAGSKATPIEYANPMPDSILQEDREIAAYPLRIAAGHIERWPVADVFAETA